METDRADGLTDGRRMYGWMDGRTDGWVDDVQIERETERGLALGLARPQRGI